MCVCVYADVMLLCCKQVLHLVLIPGLSQHTSMGGKEDFELCVLIALLPPFYVLFSCGALIRATAWACMPQALVACHPAAVIVVVL